MITFKKIKIKLTFYYINSKDNDIFSKLKK